MRTITINGNVYKAHAFDFNLLCDLEDLGVSIDDISTKPMSVLRAYVSICIGKGKDFAGTEMQNHVINGGSFEEIMQVLGEEIDASDFFQKMATDQKPVAKKTRKTTN